MRSAQKQNKRLTSQLVSKVRESANYAKILTTREDVTNCKLGETCLVKVIFLVKKWFTNIYSFLSFKGDNGEFKMPRRAQKTGKWLMNGGKIPFLESLTKITKRSILYAAYSLFFWISKLMQSFASRSISALLTHILYQKVSLKRSTNCHITNFKKSFSNANQLFSTRFSFTILLFIPNKQANKQYLTCSAFRCCRPLLYFASDSSDHFFAICVWNLVSRLGRFVLASPAT